jgi:penicillin amidase
MVDLTYPYDLGDDYSSADRALRIGELIQAKEKVDIQWVQQMQYDLVSPTARQIAAALGLIKVDDPALSSIIEKFAAWDGTLATDSQEALIYENFATRLIHHLVEGHLGSLTKNYLGRGPTPAIAEHSMWGFRAWEWLVKIIEEPESHWFNMGNGEKRDDILLLVLRETIEDLNNRLGPNHSEWTWGKQHTLSFKHTLGQARLLNLFFNRGPYPIGGDGSTVWASFAIPTKDSSGIIGPPFRFIADLSDLNHCQGMLAPGQSGQPASPHYDDQIDAWLKGEYHTMWYLRADVESHASQRLELIPA